MTKASTKISYNGESTGLLTWTSDMACWSFSLPAGKIGACPMMRADDESYICHGCYAQINRYNMPNVLRSQIVRFEWVKNCLKTKYGTSMFVNTMVEAIRKHVKNDFFRVHDSGDFFSPRYVSAWQQVCQQLPEVQFWFPTRCWPHSKNLPDKWTTALTALASLPNVSVRPSALRWGEAPPKVPFLNAGTTGHYLDQTVDAQTCPKTEHGGDCESNNCRTCWDKTTKVSYLIHGYMGKKSAANAFSDKIVSTRNRISQEVKLTLKGAAVK